MLDQNTDRMWYVIGAVIVGAALIFLMNGAFPTLFANIGATFEGKVAQTTEMTDGIRPITKPVLSSKESLEQFLNDPANWEQGGLTASTGMDSVNMYALRTDYIVLDAGTYRVSYTADSAYYPMMGVRLYDADKQYLMYTNDDPYTHEFEVTEDRGHVRFRIMYKHADTAGDKDNVTDTLISEEVSKWDFHVSHVKEGRD